MRKSVSPFFISFVLFLFISSEVRQSQCRTLDATPVQLDESEEAHKPKHKALATKSEQGRVRRTPAHASPAQVVV